MYGAAFYVDGGGICDDQMFRHCYCADLLFDSLAFVFASSLLYIEIVFFSCQLNLT
jgi:hypothetical protein